MNILSSPLQRSGENVGFCACVGVREALECSALGGITLTLSGPVYLSTQLTLRPRAFPLDQG